MPEINLSRGRVAIVDQNDFDRLSEFRWFYKPERDGLSGTAIRHVRNADGRVTSEYLSRAIARPPAGMAVTHLNRDRLDCRKENLLVVDLAHAQRRRGVRKDNKTGVKGVRFNPSNGRYVATLWREGTGRHVGQFDTATLAGEAYEQAVIDWEQAEATRIFGRSGNVREDGDIDLNTSSPSYDTVSRRGPSSGGLEPSVARPENPGSFRTDNKTSTRP